MGFDCGVTGWEWLWRRRKPKTANWRQLGRFRGGGAGWLVCSTSRIRAVRWGGAFLAKSRRTSRTPASTTALSAIDRLPSRSPNGGIRTNRSLHRGPLLPPTRPLVPPRSPAGSSTQLLRWMLCEKAKTLTAVRAAFGGCSPQYYPVFTCSLHCPHPPSTPHLPQTRCEAEIRREIQNTVARLN